MWVRAISSCARQSQRRLWKTSPVRHCEWMRTSGGAPCPNASTLKKQPLRIRFHRPQGLGLGKPLQCNIRKLSPAQILAPVLRTMGEVLSNPPTNNDAACFRETHYPRCQIHVPPEGVPVINTYLAHVHAGSDSHHGVSCIAMQRQSETHRRGRIVKQRQDAIACVLDENPLFLVNQSHGDRKSTRLNS